MNSPMTPKGSDHLEFKWGFNFKGTAEKHL